ncbi:MAG: S9 family peptidase [Bacteroidetes bacterium]|nr:S9 family peptidase [Rhodothermia bacterium]MCX7906448.1 S9 family peptidase [Bacteroidota bacterium]MDW8284860.1 S9 family peptidase [Bacteroidota bacterium]
MRAWRWILLSLLPLSIWAQERRGLSPLEVARLQMVNAAVISPDGRYIAYGVSVPADPMRENRPAATHLFVWDLRAGRVIGSFTQANVSSIAFRPGAGTVTFLASIEPNEPRSLYELPLREGAEPRRLLRHETAISDYQWAPDGERLAFIAPERIDGPGTLLPVRPIFYEEAQPQRLAFVHDVRSARSVPLAVRGSYYLLAWSPDGRRIAASVAPTPLVDDMYMAQRVHVFDAETGQVLLQIANEGKIGSIHWSPDGRRLALKAADHLHDPIDGRLMIVEVQEGARPRNVWRDFEGQFEQILWAEPELLYVLVSVGVEKALATIRADGSGFRYLVAPGLANWMSFDRASSGLVALVGNTARHPSELYLWRPGTAQPERLTEHNPWLAQVRLGEQRVVRYRTRDGAYEIEGILMLPVGYEPGRRVPLIVVVHGGPEAHYSNGWLTTYSMPGQMATGRGYAVFYPNYRGSTGRGLAFAMSSQADLAGKEFDDIVDGVDYLIAQGIVDPARVGVTGGSYGGYATAWMSTRYSDRFAAGVMFVGISNNLSKWGTSDIPNELYLVHSRTRFWESDSKWLDYLRRSPIYHVDQARTPLLILHGAEDTRVHPSQSLELYRHLKARRPEVPVRLLLYPGEGHGLVRSAARLDYSLRMMDWFDHFLLRRQRTLPPLELSGVPAGLESR